MSAAGLRSGSNYVCTWERLDPPIRSEVLRCLPQGPQGSARIVPGLFHDQFLPISFQLIIHRPLYHPYYNDTPRLTQFQIMKFQTEEVFKSEHIYTHTHTHTHTHI